MARRNRPAPASKTPGSKTPSSKAPSSSGSASTAPSAPRDDGASVGRLYILVLVAGAVLMSMEIAGSRLLAPHFGNSVFVWGSLITIFLAALSAGYFVGGILADRHPSFAALNTLCVIVGLLVALIPWAAHPLCNALLDAGAGEQSGPLAAALVLFLPPSFALGMVSPWSVRLAAREVESVGRAAGTLYAVSTAGSIIGTLGTTFVLVPNIGVSWIIKGLAGVMFLLPACMALSLRGRRAAVVPITAAAVIAIWLPAPPASTLAPGDRVVVDEDTPYHHITVVDRGGQRMLRFDRYIEGAIQIEPPHRSLAPYTDYFHLAFLAKPELESALFIGAGGGIGPATFAAVQPRIEIDVVDVDQRVLEIAEEHFFMPVDERIRPIAEDGRIFVRNTDRRYDAIFLDAFTIGGRIPFHLTTREYFQLCRDRLADDGVFFMNLNSALAGEQSEIYRSVTRTLETVFPQVSVFAVGHATTPNPQLSRNLMLIAGGPDANLAHRAWRARVERYPARSTVSRSHLHRMLLDRVDPLPDRTGGRLLTDDLAPVETMSF